MEKRLLIAIALSFGLLFLWNSVLFPPPPTPETAEVAGLSETEDLASLPESQVAAQPMDVPSEGPVAAEDEYASGAAVETRAEARVAQSREVKTIENGLYRIQVSNEGAKILSWELSEYQDDDGNPLELVSPGALKLQEYPLTLALRDQALAEKINRALFEVEEGVGEDGYDKRLTFHYSDGAGLRVTKILELAGGSYLARLRVDVSRDGRSLEGELVWGAGFGPFPGLLPSGSSIYDVPKVVFKRGGSIERLSQDDIEEETPHLEAGPISWAGLEDHYFAALFLPVGGSGGASVHRYRVIEEGREKDFLSLGIALIPSGQYDLYVGPKDHDVLVGLDVGIDGLVDFGFFGAIARFLLLGLKFLHGKVGNWGWSIIILTGFIRIAFFPLTHRSSVNMRRNQERMKLLNPKIQKIRDRHKAMKKDMANRQKMNDDIMKVYKDEGVNPLSGMAGCLPLLLQLPILWGFYNLLNVAIELRQAPFGLWIQDLSEKDPYYVTPVIMGATMLIQQVMTSSAIPDPTQRRIMMLMPVMFTWFFKDFASGLVLYWLVNNILAIGQQYLINRQASRPVAGKPAAGKPAKSKK